ncbi:TonB-dependent receptor [Sphingopyxis sp. PET50]|uniref:TonB-dependent receptor n=1 Tax=Sphingopyxis sp. PET50 TaxID=2976533 RepID=UPI0028B00A62|nr:TonB-dependent receptor [Sphingopyxis sp. PET50]
MNILNARAMLGLSASAAMLAIAAPAAAQDDAGSDEIIVTAQRNNQTEVTRGGSGGVFGDKAAEDLPFTIKSYNEALILNQQPQTLGQLLENDPSVRTGFAFGNAAELFVIRGFALAGDDVGLDGLYGIAPRQLIAPELYDSVQVINGSSAFINGAAPGGSGLGGSVNLLPKRAKRDLTRATVNYTSDEHFGGSFDAARRFGDNAEWGVRINGVARTGDVSIDGEYRSAYTLGGAFDYDNGPFRLSLDLAYQRVKVRGLRHKVALAAGVAIPEVPKADANYSQPWTYTEMRDVFGILKAEYDIADNAMIYASFGARDGMEDGIYGGITVLDAATGAANGNALYVPRTDNNEAAQAGLRVKLGSAITHEINFGGSMNWQVNRNAYDFLYGPGFAGFATNLYNAVEVPIPASALVGGDLDNPFPISRTRLLSAFASDTIGFWDDRVLLTAGLRVQSIRTKSYDYFGGGLTGTYDEDAVTPVFGLVVKPADGLAFYLNRMEGFEKPDAAPAAVGALPVTNAGEVFAPVKTKQYEFGAKYSFGRFNASLAAFQIDRPRPGVVTDPATPGQVIYGLNGEQRNKGIELSFDGELAKGLRLIAGGSIIDAKLRRTLDGVNQGNDAPGVPEYLINANVEWDLPFAPGLTLTGRVVHTGEQAANQANTLELPSWTRFDLGARYVAVVADKPLTLRFGVDNVANKRYWVSAFEIFSPDLLQGAPRTFKASASIDF